jgi:hypothetical protein
MDTTHEPDNIRERIITALKLRDKYALEFDDLCIKHSMVSDIQDEQNKIKQAEMLRNYMKSKYYTL